MQYHNSLWRKLFHAFILVIHFDDNCVVWENPLDKPKKPSCISVEYETNAKIRDSSILHGTAEETKEIT